MYNAFILLISFLRTIEQIMKQIGTHRLRKTLIFFFLYPLFDQNWALLCQRIRLRRCSHLFGLTSSPSSRKSGRSFRSGSLNVNRKKEPKSRFQFRSLQKNRKRNFFGAKMKQAADLKLVRKKEMWFRPETLWSKTHWMEFFSSKTAKFFSE